MSKLATSIGCACLLLFAILTGLAVQRPGPVRPGYAKKEYRIPMRDGVRLFTAVYTPDDTSQKYPILLNRTPYSVAPYGPTSYRDPLGPSAAFADEGYIFVYQDVRGRFMSEGDFKWMTPYKEKKTGSKEVDESTDTYDTIDWLLKNVANNNGRVGIYGISYPGFYAASALMDPHPALKAVSPQAPMADNYLGDDIHHNGAFWLPHIFTFINFFGRLRSGPTEIYPPGIQFRPQDGYQFFLQMGPLRNVDLKYFHGEVPLWDEWIAHGDYDSYWQAQDVPQHLKKTTPAVMTVGGWFDAEDLQGTLRIYRALEKYNPKNFNVLVMGPWSHGGWAGGSGNSLGAVQFGSNTSAFYRVTMELPFFNFYLKGKGNLALPEATVFETGVNEWKTYDHWPPQNVWLETLYLQPEGRLTLSPPGNSSTNIYDEYVSDPANPVPYLPVGPIGMAREYMVADQRFVDGRPDVLVYETDSLAEDVTVVGPVGVSLDVSTSGTDSDFVVKLIDVYPNEGLMNGYEMLVRGEPFRTKYRNSFSTPEPMNPNQPTEIKYDMPDINHSFLKGHRIMVQVQSSWFPLMDRNPQKFVNVYQATEEDFQTATERVYHSAQLASHLTFSRLR